MMTVYICTDFHSSDPSMTGDIGEGGEIGRGPQDTDKVHLHSYRGRRGW